HVDRRQRTEDGDQDRHHDEGERTFQRDADDPGHLRESLKRQPTRTGASAPGQRTLPVRFVAPNRLYMRTGICSRDTGDVRPGQNVTDRYVAHGYIRTAR